jgi:hypothetical protein
VQSFPYSQDELINAGADNPQLLIGQTGRVEAQ